MDELEQGHELEYSKAEWLLVEVAYLLFLTPHSEYRYQVWWYQW